jgi:chromosome segregation ATPase
LASGSDVDFQRGSLNHDALLHKDSSDFHSGSRIDFEEETEDGSSHAHITRPRSQTKSSTASHVLPRVHVDTEDLIAGAFRSNTIQSPGDKIASFFGWKGRQSSVTESQTTISDQSLSPMPSPMQVRRNNEAPKMVAPPALDIPKANAAVQNSFFTVPGTPLLSNSPGINAHVEELERELKHISSELAESIRREMELEDEIERLRLEVPTITTADNRRTSDYYSDSGASSVRYPFSDNESKLDELEKLRRRAEQEKAQIKMEMAERIQDELRKRRDLEAQVLSLEEEIQSGEVHSGQGSASERLRELESSLEDARRRLVEERKMKENLEDLLAAFKEELEDNRNERDNLRDEVVPQLKLRVEGLELQAAEYQNLAYENARMQQNIESLKKQIDMQQQQNRFNSIAEEAEGEPQSSQPRVGLSRSNSLARNSSMNPKRMSLSRSNSIKERSESRESLSERIKDVEEQRDALHKALKNLLERQIIQEREHAKRIKILETERDSALNASPRRRAFHKEVSHLRDEVNHLRRRADEAIEQKYQCEKGLSGLRMDLDRAQQETTSLRDLLKEHDIFIPDGKSSTEETQKPSTNASIPLDRAYKELQTTHALSLASIRQMEIGNGLIAADSEIGRTLELLKQSISDAEAERDSAIREAEVYRQQARSLQQSEIAHLNKEQSLAAELLASAKRMDDLSAKVQVQLFSNKKLRERLANAIARGEEEQKQSAARIVELERRLKAYEDRVVNAQHQSDEAITRHEREVRLIKDSHNAQLQRMKNGLFTSGQASPVAPLSPMLLRTPQLEHTSSGPGMSIADATKIASLEKKVVDLEKALVDADKEMEEVVSRMNLAQIEVAELQSERYAHILVSKLIRY